MASPAPRAPLALTAVAFFASGLAALVYQVAWQRILALHTGVGIYSVAMIVAAFMAGLGIGSHLGGVLSVRLSPQRALLAFGVLEVLIAVFGAVSVPSTTTCSTPARRGSTRRRGSRASSTSPLSCPRRRSWACRCPS